MSIPPPYIDKRTYDDIVRQTQELAEEYASVVVDLSTKDTNENIIYLCDKTLAQDIVNDEITIAKSGDILNEELAREILQIPDLSFLKIKGWQTSGKTDAGLALIRIFGRMTTLVSDRLNRVPEKNFLAFLNLIGAECQPPQPAKVPLTFGLVAGSPNKAIVPARTQVSASATETEEEVIFETTQDLVVNAAKLQAVFVKHPKEHKYSDRTLEAKGKKDNAFLAFGGESEIESYLYLSCDEVFGLSQLQAVELKFKADGVNSLEQLQELLNVYSYWDGSQWEDISKDKIEAHKTQKQLKIRLAEFPVLISCDINRQEAKWLRISLKNSNFDSIDDLPEITTVEASTEVNHQVDAPQSSLYNATPLDLTKEFYPFGENPRHNDTFYIELDRELVKPKGTVELKFTLSHVPQITKDLNLIWEIGSDSDWELINTQSRFKWIESGSIKFAAQECSSTLRFPDDLSFETTDVVPLYIRVRIDRGRYGKAPVVRKYSYYNDVALLKPNNEADTKKVVLSSTDGLIEGDIVRFQPNDLSSLEEHKIASVDSETEVTLKEKLEHSHTAGTRILRKFVVSETIPETFDPPIVRSLQLTYEFNVTKPVRCLAYNDFTYHENHFFSTHLRETAASGDRVIQVEDTGSLAVGELVMLTNDSQKKYQIVAINRDRQQITLNEGLAKDYHKTVTVNHAFVPLIPLLNKNPTIYFGFDRDDAGIPFNNSSASLYFQVEAPQPEEVKPQEDSTSSGLEPPKIVWEYSSPDGWKPLGVKDGTATFTRRGIIQFLAPADFNRDRQFAKSHYWLRGRWVSGNFRFGVIPRLRRVLTNTVWATQTVTLHDEILGSSLGEPRQVFFVRQTPVLYNQILEVEEGRLPPFEEQEAIEKQFGKNAIAVIKNDADEVEEVWVRWQQVADFYSSNATDRHYVLDRQTGEIKFGDGQAGMVPPRRRNNIRLSSYQTGGGTLGNRDAGTINQLKTTIPYIDSVTNYEAARGGAEQESLTRVKQRVPKQLRHRDRAVTNQDFEDLAYESFAEIARVKVISPELRQIGTKKSQDYWNPLDEKNWIDKSGEVKKKSVNKRKQIKPSYVEVIIVPHSRDRIPTPSLELIERVENYLSDRCLTTVELAVTAPKWQEITVKVEIVPLSLEAADTVRIEVAQSLSRFLHPLTGGKRGSGWNFGRYPHKSDLYALLEAVKGVDYISDLEIQPSNLTIDALTLIYSGTHEVRMRYG